MALNRQEKLKELFQNPEFGLGNLTTFYKKLKDTQLREQFNITYDYQYNEVKHFYNSQQVTQRFYEAKLPKSCRITAFWFGHIIQMDLMVIGGGKTPQGHLKGLQKINGVRYLLNIVDVFSRYAWSFPLKNKQALTVVASNNKDNTTKNQACFTKF